MSEAMRKQEAVSAIQRARVSAIIRTNDQTLAADAMSAAVEGGFKIVEFTLTTPGAMELIAQFAKQDHLTVGAGTVMTVEQARQAVAAGASFLVSPIVDAEIVAETQSLGVVSIPGGATPTEMERAHRCGADFVKVFPAPAGGADFIRAIRGPLPHLRLFPTAGVTADNLGDFLDAGCAGAGFVRSLFDPADLQNGNLSAIRHRAAAIVSAAVAWHAA